jgi:plastocyanin
MITHWKAALLLAVLSCAEAAAQTAQIDIDNFSFSPSTLTVQKGTTVVWTNRDDIPHTVVSSDGRSFKSQALDSDDAYSFTFDTAGQYGYFCSLHPHMQGTVIVQ